MSIFAHVRSARDKYYYILIRFFIFLFILRTVNLILGQSVVKIINEASGLCLIHDVKGLVSTKYCGSYPENEKWSLPDNGISISFGLYSHMCLDANWGKIYSDICGSINIYQQWEYDKSVIGTTLTTTIKHDLTSKFLSNQNGIFIILFEYNYTLISLNFHPGRVILSDEDNSDNQKWTIVYA